MAAISFLSIGLIAEGQVDHIVINKIINSFFSIPIQIQFLKSDSYQAFIHRIGKQRVKALTDSQNQLIIICLDQDKSVNIKRWCEIAKKIIEPNQTSCFLVDSDSRKETCSDLNASISIEIGEKVPVIILVVKRMIEVWLLSCPEALQKPLRASFTRNDLKKFVNPEEIPHPKNLLKQLGYLEFGRISTQQASQIVQDPFFSIEMIRKKCKTCALFLRDLELAFNKFL